MFVKCAQVAATNNDYKVFVATQELANCSNSVEYVAKTLGISPNDTENESIGLAKEWSIIVYPNADVPDYYPMMISARAYESVRQYITEKTVTVFAWSSTM